MRLSKEAFDTMKNKSMRVHPENHTETDKLVLDLRDTKEAVKILRERLDKAQEEIKMLRGLSESQAKALNMMEAGTM